MNCSKCGSKMTDTASFCPSCGSPVTREETKERFSGVGTIRIGFSDKINDPSILKALKKNKKATGIFGIILAIIPIIVGLVMAIKKDDFKSLIYGVIISAIFLAITLFSLTKKKLERQWDGTVIEKSIEVKQDTSSDDNSNSTYKVYITKIRKDNGGTKKIQEREYNLIYFDYLQEGDRVRYHPQFNCYYEKYDKSHDSYAVCPICQSINELSRDTCGRCGAVVIK